MDTELTVYGDTNTLPSNSSNACSKEMSALNQLWHVKGLKWFSSHLVNYEVGKTTDESKRNRLVAEYKEREIISKDERIVGVNIQYLSSPYGGFVSFYLLSDVQDEPLRAELIQQRFDQRDAEHIAQAVSNKCDVFLTRDKRTILNRRSWLENRFPAMKVLLPSELLAELEARTLPHPPPD